MRGARFETCWIDSVDQNEQVAPTFKKSNLSRPRGQSIRRGRGGMETGDDTDPVSSQRI